MLPTSISIKSKKINVDKVLRQVTRDSTGAVVFFVGIVRAENKSEPAQVVEYLEYEAYQPMAKEMLEKVIEEIRATWPNIEGISIHQCIGRIKKGEITTIIACSSAHRDSGIFEAARYGIDRIKEIVPVWKKEIGQGITRWKEGNYHPKPGE
jgi:MoaE-MoaD fusion protein